MHINVAIEAAARSGALRRGLGRKPPRHPTLLFAAAFAAVSLLSPAAAEAPRKARPELQLLGVLNAAFNHSHAPGERVSNDPDGLWDDDNYAFMKYRALRDVMMWPDERLALGVARFGRVITEYVVLVRTDGGWVVLDGRNDEIAQLKDKLREGWRIEAQPYEPAPAPSAPWVMSPRNIAIHFAHAGA